MTKLTDSYVRSVTCPAGKKSIDVGDGNSLYLRVSANEKKIWRVRYRSGQKQLNVTIGLFPQCSLKEARKKRDELLSVTPSVSFEPEPVEKGLSPTIKQLVDEYLSTISDQASHHEAQRCLQKHVVRFFGEREAEKVKRREWVLHLSELAKRTPTQANRVLAYLKRSYVVGVKRGLIEMNPTMYMDKPAPQVEIRNNTHKVMTRAQLHSLYMCLVKSSYRFDKVTLIMLLTGGRPADVLTMKWQQFDNQIWTLGPKEHKGGHKRPVSVYRPVISLIKEIVEPYRDNKSEYIFPGKTGKASTTSTFDKFVRKTRLRYGMEQFTPMHLRHSISTRMREIGINADIAERIIGHTVDSQIASTYNHYLWVPEMEKALEQWHQWIKNFEYFECEEANEPL